MNFNEQHELKTLPERMAALEKEIARLQEIMADLWLSSSPRPRAFPESLRRIRCAAGRIGRGGRSLARTRNAQGRARGVEGRAALSRFASADSAAHTVDLSVEMRDQIRR